MKRLWEIDALRGLMLVLMTLTHLPTRLAEPLGQPLGWVSAAEGFVLLSAFMAGLVYSRQARREGVPAMRRAFWRRALVIYLCHAALLLFMLTAIAALGVRGRQTAVTDLLSFYLARPLDGFVYGLLLVYEPALLDILPMYILFMLLSPWVLAFAMRHGWAAVLALSATLWMLAQQGLSEWLYARAVALAGLPVPYQDMGAFNAFAWQLLWFCGLWLGAQRSVPEARPIVFAWPVLALAVIVVAGGLYWRHFGLHGQAPFGADVQRNLWLDKWQLGPLRLANLAALGVLLVRFGPACTARLPPWLRPRALEVLGRASLPAFCAHLVAVLIVLAVWGASPWARPPWGDALLLAAVFAWMLAVARLTQRADGTPPHG